MSQHLFCHIELSAADRAGAGQFYQSVFGWEVRQIPEMNYATMMTADDQVGAGLNPIAQDNPAGTVMVYISTDDICQTLEKIKNQGGEVLSDPMPIPGVGLFAFFKDPTGNKLALLEAHEDQK